MNRSTINTTINECVVSSVTNYGRVPDESTNIALVIHLFYEKLFDECINCLDSIPDDIDVFITTNTVSKKSVLEDLCHNKKIRYKEIRVVSNIGREISALLIACRDIWDDYDILGFLHDKSTSGNIGPAKIGESYMYLLWENMLKNKTYINNLIFLLKNNNELGLLVPPSPYHDGYFSNYGNEWTLCYERTAKLASDLGISKTISKDIPPVSLGTAFWCKTEALSNLWKYDWHYSSFCPEPMPIDNTINHAIERILPFVAENAGYITSVVMCDTFSSVQLSNYHYILNTLVKKISMNSCFGTYDDLINHHDYLSFMEIQNFCSNHKKNYVYGLGFFSRELSKYLKSHQIDFDGYIVSDGYKSVDITNGKKIYELSEITPDPEIGIIVAMNNLNTKEVVEKLLKNGFSELYFNKNKN